MGEKADAESKRVAYKAVLIREQRAEVRRVMQSVGSLVNRCDAVRYQESSIGITSGLSTRAPARLSTGSTLSSRPKLGSLELPRRAPLSPEVRGRS